MPAPWFELIFWILIKNVQDDTVLIKKSTTNEKIELDTKKSKITLGYNGRSTLYFQGKKLLPVIYFSCSGQFSIIIRRIPEYIQQLVWCSKQTGLKNLNYYFEKKFFWTFSPSLIILPFWKLIFFIYFKIKTKVKLWNIFFPFLIESIKFRKNNEL